MPEWNVRRRSGKLLRVYPIVKPSRYLPRLANIVAEIGRIAPIDVILILIFILIKQSIYIFIVRLMMNLFLIYRHYYNMYQKQK